MEYRQFGNTDLKVSVIGFGAWAIGGPAMAGSIPIGWGNVDDKTSADAIRKSVEAGVNFFDTADFYGLGHSEELIGNVIGNNPEIIIATKVGHKLSEKNDFILDYSKDHITLACEKSLKRLRRDCIDYYQLHSARTEHLINGECIEAMEELRDAGKIRFWGLSLNTFNPFPEAEFLISRKIANGFQLVFNLINQRALSLFKSMYDNSYGIIARMPLQFGLLTGKFDSASSFEKADHRSFRLTKEIIAGSNKALESIWKFADKYKISKTTLSLSYILNYPEISTVIPGIKTPEQAIENSQSYVQFENEEMDLIRKIYKDEMILLLDKIEKQG
ncbi:MAG: aldo/keto reductase [Ignavibacteriales bacterium]|nr:MAG: aldo/keto reductase [Ignavibacteriales bacterium]